MTITRKYKDLDAVEKAAVEWRRNVVAEEKLVARLDPDRWQRVHYEDLCSEPKTQLEKLCVFLNLDPSLVNMDFRSAGLHVFGNVMRLSSETGIILDEQWRTELTKSQVATVESIAGKELRRFGYLAS